jgi:acyl carrier protein
MAVLAVLTQIEEDFGLSIPDDEVSADHFLTYGDLAAFVRARLG